MQTQRSCHFIHWSFQDHGPYTQNPHDHCPRPTCHHCTYIAYGSSWALWIIYWYRTWIHDQYSTHFELFFIMKMIPALLHLLWAEQPIEWNGKIPPKPSPQSPLNSLEAIHRPISVPSPRLTSTRQIHSTSYVWYLTLETLQVSALLRERQRDREKYSVLSTILMKYKSSLTPGNIWSMLPQSGEQAFLKILRMSSHVSRTHRYIHQHINILPVTYLWKSLQFSHWLHRPH